MENILRFPLKFFNVGERILSGILVSLDFDSWFGSIFYTAHVRLGWI